MSLNSGCDPATPAPLRAVQSQDGLPREAVKEFSASAAVRGEREAPQRCLGIAGPEVTTVPLFHRYVYLRISV